MTTNNAELRQEKVETLNELIQATRDSAEFYADAAKAVKNPQLRSLFDDMAESKQGLVGSMAREVRAEAGRRLGHLVQRAEFADEQVGERARIHARRLGKHHRGVGRQIAMRGIARRLDRDIREIKARGQNARFGQ